MLTEIFLMYLVWERQTITPVKYQMHIIYKLSMSMVNMSIEQQNKTRKHMIIKKLQTYAHTNM